MERNHIIKHLGFCLFSLPCFLNLAFANGLNNVLPEIEELPGMQTQWIGKQMVINGVPTSMRAFSSPKSSREVLNEYAHRWKSRSLSAITHSEFDGNKSVGMEYRNHFYSVQAKDVYGGSEGVLTVSVAPSDIQPDFSTRFPLPLGAKVEQKIESLDQGAMAETLVVTGEQSASSMAAFVETTLNREGWVSQNYAEPSSVLDQYVLNYQRGTELSQITILGKSPAFSDKTMMTIHWVKN